MLDFSQLKYYVPSQRKEIPLEINADLCIYGATPAGIAAAVQAKRMGLNVVLTEFSHHVGGITASGLGRTDHGYKKGIGGIARQFYRELGKWYGSKDEDELQWYFEPHIAKKVFQEWLDNAGVNVYYNCHLASVVKKQGNISRITMENGDQFHASMFIDASYEGDLMAMSGVSYHVGRESNAVYSETRNGIQFGSPYHMFNIGIDPYVIEGKPDSGLLPGVTDVSPGIQGHEDKSVQAYNFRICLTNDPSIRIPVPEPVGYDPQRYAILGRYIRAGAWEFTPKKVPDMPGNKTDMNNFGAFSTDHIGANHEWPDADYAARERIFQDHVNYTMGLLYFISNDESIPLALRQDRQRWGLAIDEFPTTGHWPHQLYIRESRRMISSVVMNEKHCRHLKVEQDSIGLASYSMDSHNCRRLVIEGFCVNEGNVEILSTGPYPISYRSIIPTEEECGNLLVPVCLSSSHIAYGSIRMEPVFMILGQSAATAAVLALKAGVSVQDVSYQDLKQQLIMDGQVLEV